MNHALNSEDMVAAVTSRYERGAGGVIGWSALGHDRGTVKQPVDAAKNSRLSMKMGILHPDAMTLIVVGNDDRALRRRADQ